MLKKRISACLLMNNYSMIKGKHFKNYRTLNDISASINIFCLRDIDELVILDIEKYDFNKKPNINYLREISGLINVPLLYGGGIKSVDDASWCLLSGADKISINTALYDNKNLLKDLSKKFGSQSIVASIDVLKKENEYFCVSHSGNIIQKYEPSIWSQICEDNGCGEILLNSINMDGTMSGYDYELISKIKNKIRIPLMVSGGAGNYEHLLNAIKLGASSVVASSMYHFTGLTPSGAKKFLHNNSISVRDAHKYI